MAWNAQDLNAERAVSAMVAAFEDGTNGLTAQLRALETRLSLSANTFPDPDSINGARLPEDNRAHLIEIYDEGSTREGPDLERVEVILVHSFLAENAGDLAGAETLARRYGTAIRTVVHRDASLGDRVQKAVWMATDAEALGHKEDHARIRMIRAYQFDVLVYAAGCGEL